MGEDSEEGIEGPFFELSDEEFADVKSQNATSSSGGWRTRPQAFTEHDGRMTGKISPANRALILLLLAIAILLALFFESMDTELEQRATVEQRIGAGIESPYIEAEGRLTEVIAFMSVKPDGAAAQAGIKEGDIVIEDIWFGELCDRFASPAGTIVSVEVVAGGDGPAIAERSRRTVAIRLP